MTRPEEVATGLGRSSRLLLVALALQFIAIGGWQAWHDSPTWDEGVYAAAGLTALTQHELRINLEHPPLAKVLAALPPWIAGVRFNVDDAWQRGDDYTYTRELLAQQAEEGTLQRTMFLFRLVPLALGLLTAWVLYALARDLFTPTAGIIAAGVWLTIPLTVGLTHVNGIDLPFALATLTLALLLNRFLLRPRPATLVLIGLATGGALLIRFTGLLLIPLVVGTVAVATIRDGWWRAVRASAVVCLLAWIVVWAGVRMIAPFPDAPASAVTTQRGQLLLSTVPWPREYVVGIVQLKQVSVAPAPAFLLGQAWTGARWWYWPASLAIKLPIPTVVILMLGMVATPFLTRPGARGRLLLTVYAPAVLLGVFALFQPRPIGVRYLLPPIALGLVAGAGAVTLIRRRSIRSGLIVGLLAVQVAWLWESHPHSLAWTAPPFRPGYKVASDSSLDWGQDFYRLLAWSRGRHPWVSYAGPPGIGVERIPGARSLLGTPPAIVEGWAAVSATNLTVYERDRLSWLRAYCPVGTLGGSILLYRFNEPPTAEPGRDAPPGLCEGSYSYRS